MKLKSIIIPFIVCLLANFANAQTATVSIFKYDFEKQHFPLTLTDNKGQQQTYHLVVTDLEEAWNVKDRVEQAFEYAHYLQFDEKITLKEIAMTEIPLENQANSRDLVLSILDTYLDGVDYSLINSQFCSASK